MAVDAKGIGQAERDLGAGRLGEPRRLAEGGLGLLTVEQIALEIDDLGGLEQARVEVVGGEVDTRAEKGVHGALAVRRDEDKAARGRRSVRGRQGVIVDP